MLRMRTYLRNGGETGGARHSHYRVGHDLPRDLTAESEHTGVTRENECEPEGGMVKLYSASVGRKE